MKPLITFHEQLLEIRDVFKTLSNIYDVAFSKNIYRLNAIIFRQISSIIDILQGPKFALELVR